MKLVKCPRCDLNYIQENEKYCKVCMRELKASRCRKKWSFVPFACGPALPEKMYAELLKEMQQNAWMTMAMMT